MNEMCERIKQKYLNHECQSRCQLLEVQTNRDIIENGLRGQLCRIRKNTIFGREYNI